MVKSLDFVKLDLPWQYDPYSDPPLGMLSVAEVAKNLDHLDITLTDMAHDKEPRRADVFAFSASTLEFPEAVKQAEEVMRRFPESKTIAGGPHFDALSEEYWKKEINNTPFDIVCRGEGETTISRAIEHLNNGGGKIVISQEGPLLDLDGLSFPARDLLDKEKYFKPGKTFGGNELTDGNSSTIMVSRGCPHSCGFCASPALHRRSVRFRGLESVSAELDELTSLYGVSALRWQDDCMPYTIRRIGGLAERLHESGILSRGSARTDEIVGKNGLKEGILDNLIYAGFREIGFGIESAENQVLAYLSKGTTVEKNRQALVETKKSGLITRAFMMTGLPGETKDSAKRMIDFLEETNPDVVTLTSFIPLPGSDIYKNPQNYGVTIETRDWSQYDIALKWDAETAWTHKIETATLGEMETNREMLKEYLFNRGKSNVPIYNKPYVAKISEKDLKD